MGGHVLSDPLLEPMTELPLQLDEASREMKKRDPHSLHGKLPEGEEGLQRAHVIPSAMLRSFYEKAAENHDSDAVELGTAHMDRVLDQGVEAERPYDVADQARSALGGLTGGGSSMEPHAWPSFEKYFQNFAGNLVKTPAGRENEPDGGTLDAEAAKAIGDPPEHRKAYERIKVFQSSGDPYDAGWASEALESLAMKHPDVHPFNPTKWMRVDDLGPEAPAPKQRWRAV